MGLKVSSSSRAAASLAMSPAANRRRPGKHSDQSRVLMGGTTKYLNKELCTFEASAVLCFRSSCRTLTQNWGWNKGYTPILLGCSFLFVFLKTAAYRINKDKRMATTLNKPKVPQHWECSQEVISWWTLILIEYANSAVPELQAPGSSLPSSSSQASNVHILTQQRWLPRWPQPSPAAGGWRWRRSLKTCFSPPCCWAGVPCSSCSNLRASTRTCVKDQVSGSRHPWQIYFVMLFQYHF